MIVMEVVIGGPPKIGVAHGNELAIGSDVVALGPYIAIYDFFVVVAYVVSQLGSFDLFVPFAIRPVVKVIAEAVHADTGGLVIAGPSDRRGVRAKR